MNQFSSDHPEAALYRQEGEPKRPAFPWPFADRTPSFVPKSITPAQLDRAPTVWAREHDEFPWGLWIGGFFAFAAVGAFIAAALIHW